MGDGGVDRGLVPADEFIPVAEETGFIVPIGEWALRQACVDAASWREDIKIAVNLSASQFRNQALPQTVRPLRVACEAFAGNG